jgi:uncharacterized protein YhfF
LADLVFAGIKRATASLVRDYEEGREPTPRFGDFIIMPDGEGRPRFIWRTTEVTVKPLSQVDEAFAWDEGEGDRTRDCWLDAHRRYFARQATREGVEMDDEILTVFERFEVVWPLDVAVGLPLPSGNEVIEGAQVVTRTPRRQHAAWNINIHSSCARSRSLV